MKVRAELVKGKDLTAGDLFSTMGEECWNSNSWADPFSIGKRVYIRTNAPLPKEEWERDIYRITIMKDDDIDWQKRCQQSGFAFIDERRQVVALWTLLNECREFSGLPRDLLERIDAVLEKEKTKNGTSL